MSQEALYQKLGPPVRGAPVFCLAAAAAGLYAYFGGRNILDFAIISTLTVAGTSKVFFHPFPFEDDRNPVQSGTQYLAEASLAAVGVVISVFPLTRNFLCEPLVPWNISIGIFGAFTMTWISTASAIQAPGVPVSLMILIAFFWIAPFYGFFHGPWFLAQTLVAPCAGRSWMAGALVAASTVLAPVGGRWTARRLFPDGR